MTQKTYIVEGRQFRTEADYNRAVHDKEMIDKLRDRIQKYDRKQLEELKAEIHSGRYRFMTMLGQDFEDELDELIRKSSNGAGKGKKENRKKENKKNEKPGKENRDRSRQNGNILQSDTSDRNAQSDPDMDAIVEEELRKRERRRRLLIAFSGVLAAGCLGYFGVYSYYNYRTSRNYVQMSEMKEQPSVFKREDSPPVIHYTSNEDVEPKEVLEEYKNLLNKNKKLIGWVKIDDTNIDYPVMQTSDNEYYLDHNLNQEYDRNGSIFLDKDCDVLKPSTNFILYGHHMRSGQMFGKLDLYEKEDYYKEHPYIQFDTIYERGIWQIMYVFRSRVYSEEEIVFKYYQFIDAVSEQEF